VQPAQNDPVWGEPAPFRAARTLTANVEPLRTRAGDCYAGVPPEILKAWYFRLLKNEGAPACSDGGMRIASSRHRGTPGPGGKVGSTPGGTPT
jgi:hypothetical protein